MMICQCFDSANQLDRINREIDKVKKRIDYILEDCKQKEPTLTEQIATNVYESLKLFNPNISYNMVTQRVTEYIRSNNLL